MKKLTDKQIAEINKSIKQNVRSLLMDLDRGSFEQP